MRVMYIAPRFHTNQVDIVNGWINNGDTVCFLSHYQGKTEDYSDIEPKIIGYSKIFMAFYYLYTNIVFKDKPDAGNIKLKCGFPPCGKIRKMIKEFNPEVVIIREKSVYSMIAYVNCRRCKIKTILYNQSPVWEDEIKNDLPHRIVNLFSPKVRITPVLGLQTDKKVREENVHYVPFVMKPRFSPSERILQKKETNVIEIFEVGKYEKRKNHLLLLEALKDMSKEYSFHLSIAGECANYFQQKYYDEVYSFIKENQLENEVTLYKNLSKIQMEERYRNSDLFIIPSTNEPASISQLEAMAYSLPVICSDTNGTACYVENGKNGYLFKDNDLSSLRKAIEKILNNEEIIVKMGQESFRLIKEKYQFDNYYDSICNILKEN